jgi:4-hydroxy-tetrahydrodipicolinate synthase
MPRHNRYIPQGVIPAVLLPFTPDLAIDEASYRSHLRDVTAAPGLSAITINAHSTEAASCTFDEQRRVMAITQDEVGDHMPIVHGVYAEGSLEGARIAKQAANDGASALLVFPPDLSPWGTGRRW